MTTENRTAQNVRFEPSEEERWTPTQQELAEILLEHKKWLDSKGEHGKPANLVGARISDSNLAGVKDPGADMPEDIDLPESLPIFINLSQADLAHADLSGAQLPVANLSRSSLSFADLSGAEIQSSNLKQASLINADLSRVSFALTNLTGANLSGADLSEADLIEANLSNASLSGASLLGADLTKVDLQSAALDRASLDYCTLRDANLEKVTGLQAQQLRGGNVSNATLPDTIARFEGLSTVREATQSARKLFISVLVACAYAALAITLTTGGSEDIELPIIGLNVGTNAFFLATPPLLALLHGYFHLQMQRLWEEVANLPAIFPDGKPLDRKIHPWLVTGVARAHVKLLKEQPFPPFFPLQYATVWFLAWGTVPATIGYFLSMYPAIPPGWSLLIYLLLALTLGGSIAAYLKVKHTLELQGHDPFPWKRPWRSTGLWLSIGCFLLAGLAWYLRFYDLPW
jgi:uncharacterized protein YjbI with pentapeptide repeats